MPQRPPPASNEPPLLPADPAARAYASLLEDWADESLYFVVGAFKWLNLANRSKAMDRTASELGGGELHSRRSGVTDHLASSDGHALEIVREIVDTLAPRAPAPWERRPASEPAVDPATLLGVIPDDLRRKIREFQGES